MRFKQSERIFMYINQYGSISPLEAFRDLGITKLATVVSNMKRDGIQFYQQMQKSKNRWGEDCWFMRYWLDPEKFKKDTEEFPF